MEAGDLLQGKSALPAQHLCHPRSGAKEGHQIFGFHPVLIHGEFDGSNRIGRTDKEMRMVVGGDQGSKHIEFVALRRPERGISHEEGGCPSLSRLVVCGSPDRLERGLHRSFFRQFLRSIRSPYSA